MPKRTLDDRVLDSLRTIRFGRSAIGIAHMLDLPVAKVREALEQLVATGKAIQFVHSRVVLYRKVP